MILVVVVVNREWECQEVKLLCFRPPRGNWSGAKMTRGQGCNSILVDVYVIECTLLKIVFGPKFGNSGGN